MESKDNAVVPLETEVSEQETDLAAAVPKQWIMKSMKPKHYQICALRAEGKKNTEVAALCGVTPEYVSLLMRQPLIQNEIQRLTSTAAVELEAMFVQSVGVLGDVLANGTNGEKLKAVRIHGELTKRIGRPDPNANAQEGNEDRLINLAERLTGLLAQKQGEVIDHDKGFEDVTDVE